MSILHADKFFKEFVGMIIFLFVEKYIAMCYDYTGRI